MPSRAGHSGSVNGVALSADERVTVSKGVVLLCQFGRDKGKLTYDGKNCAIRLGATPPELVQRIPSRTSFPASEDFSTLQCLTLCFKTSELCTSG